MQRDDVAKIIRNACKSLTVAQATEIAAATVPVGVPAEGFAFRQGDRSDGVMILVRGSVEILRQATDGSPRTLATVTAPTVLGEMGLITERPRSASVKAVTGCEFHLLTKKDFKRMLDEEMVSAFKLVGMLADVMARRLEAADEKLLEITVAAETAAREAASAAAAAQAAASAPTAPAPAPAPVAAAPATAPVAELTALRDKLFGEWSF
jgi:CRP-like cAMP-binding protein